MIVDDHEDIREVVHVLLTNEGYQIIEAKDGKGGIYRSSDRGASWTKQSGVFTSGNYYQEVDVDPKNENRIFITDTYNKVSDDGGKTVRNLGEINKHVDNHAIWIDPNNTDHLLVGCDGGIYETYDFAKTWEFKSNLPVTQFYKVSTDNAVPFYNVHGGTQDNFSLGGPSRNISAKHHFAGIVTHLCSSAAMTHQDCILVPMYCSAPTTKGRNGEP